VLPVRLMSSSTFEWPLVAESGPSFCSEFADLNVRFGEKRTSRCYFHNAENSGRYLSTRTAALPPEAAIELVLVKRSANDPKQTLAKNAPGGQCMFRIGSLITSKAARLVSSTHIEKADGKH